MLKTIIHTGLSLIFPDRCVGCGQWGKICCQACYELLPKANQLDLPNNIEAEFNYRHPAIKQLIWLLKYRGSYSAADCLAQGLYLNLMETFGLNPTINLVPVPTTKNKLRQRGYNQAEILAKAIANCHPTGQILVQSQWLKKIKTTIDQTATLNKQARWKNLTGAFAADLALTNQAISPVIVIDDVITTGATMSEAINALTLAGCQSVVGLAAAH